MAYTSVQFQDHIFIATMAYTSIVSRSQWHTVIATMTYTSIQFQGHNGILSLLQWHTQAYSFKATMACFHCYNGIHKPTISRPQWHCHCYNGIHKPTVSRPQWHVFIAIMAYTNHLFQGHIDRFSLLQWHTLAYIVNATDDITT